MQACLPPSRLRPSAGRLLSSIRLRTSARLPCFRSSLELSTSHPLLSEGKFHRSRKGRWHVEFVTFQEVAAWVAGSLLIVRSLSRLHAGERSRSSMCPPFVRILSGSRDLGILRDEEARAGEVSSNRAPRGSPPCADRWCACDIITFDCRQHKQPFSYLLLSVISAARISCQIAPVFVFSIIELLPHRGKLLGLDYRKVCTICDRRAGRTEATDRSLPSSLPASGRWWASIDQ